MKPRQNSRSRELAKLDTAASLAILAVTFSMTASLLDALGRFDLAFPAEKFTDGGKLLDLIADDLDDRQERNGQ